MKNEEKHPFVGPHNLNDRKANTLLCLIYPQCFIKIGAMVAELLRHKTDRLTICKIVRILDLTK